MEKIKQPPCAMTIAGSDSGGGAGIQADLKAFAAYGVHGTCVITAITAQNTYSVTAVHVLPPDMVAEQIKVVVEDLPVKAAKTGMLYNSEIIEVVAANIKRYSIPLVVDPVMIAKSGALLLREDAINSLVDVLLPVAMVVTPNRMEAEKLSGMKITNLREARRAAVKISELGCKAVVVKGGHLEGDQVVDVLYHEGSFYEFSSPRLPSRNTHGTGCTFSAAIAAGLAKGLFLPEAVRAAKEFTFKAIKHGPSLGKGHGPVNPTGEVVEKAERFEALMELYKAIELVEAESALAKLSPETQINIAVALPMAESLDGVAGVPGRIVNLGDRLKASSCPRFGASRHVGRAVLTAMKYEPRVRAGMNIKYSKEIVEAAKSLGLTVSYYDRREEPPEVKAKEGATIPWGISEAIKRVNAVPDLVYHFGDWGKEPMCIIFGKTAVEVVNKAIAIARKLKEAS